MFFLFIQYLADILEQLLYQSPALCNSGTGIRCGRGRQGREPGFAAGTAGAQLRAPGIPVVIHANAEIGRVQTVAGAPETVSCKVFYWQTSATVHEVAANCTSATFEFQQKGELTTVREGRYVGEFENEQYQIHGKLRVLFPMIRELAGATDRAPAFHCGSLRNPIAVMRRRPPRSSASKPRCWT